MQLGLTGKIALVTGSYRPRLWVAAGTTSRYPK